MKKRIVICLIGILLLLFSSVSHADNLVDQIGSTWKTLVFSNTTGGEYVKYSVPTTTVIPDVSLILGVVVFPLDSGRSSEALVALYDGPGGASIVSDEVFDEVEADGTSLPPWYPYPRKILTQLNVHVGPNSRAIVYWE